jgi:uncharacterized protein (DUF1684 family)
MKFFFLAAFWLCQLSAGAQNTYRDSLKTYLKNYVDGHEVVKGADRKKMQFFPVDKSYRVLARFERIENGNWFQVPTSGKMKQTYKVYGVLHFQLKGKSLTLHLYQSQSLLQNEEYRNYLFLPFTDLTTGKECYESGRYIDLKTEDIKNGQVLIDFNKAYNPYCAYVSGIYNCPIPPRENQLPIAIRAGEKKFLGHK